MQTRLIHSSPMVSLEDLPAQLLALPVRDRANLASMLLSSLPPDFEDDDGVEEALRREAQMEADPSYRVTLAEFEQEFSAYQKRDRNS